MTHLPSEQISHKIYQIRGYKVMLDKDLAELYQVETKRLNEQVRRNTERFPEDFMFQLTQDEFESLKSQIVILDSTDTIKAESLRSQFATLENNMGKHNKYKAYAFTENGIAMLSSVLKSKVAIQININIMRTFTKIKEFNSNYKDIVLELREFKQDIQQQLNNTNKETEQNTKHIKKAFEFLSQILEDTQNIENKIIGFKVPTKKSNK